MAHSPWPMAHGPCLSPLRPGHALAAVPTYAADDLRRQSQHRNVHQEAGGRRQHSGLHDQCAQSSPADTDTDTCRDTARAATATVSCAASTFLRARVCTRGFAAARGDKGAHSLFVSVPRALCLLHDADSCPVCIALPKRRRGITTAPRTGQAPSPSSLHQRHS
ncbi:hypothetical protein SNOG_05181 [Parastagonospora nodorum SN15]|uniref:Uncharacterized protein n=1 Tax=Phaeosphaeria nodorum (strain SN15 / ATCC MYA-4574 / FGSC 10173) TaxID=321614 RepID=Q0UST3_PHANO|nr:hypothetical protein SNOG_05181 [Parastagonospora nodorum SN15]EAT87572.1 hypothetical protein SNOG_05181 [Parastagonospora nodorum SN15]